jgi:hypothetical protein
MRKAACPLFLSVHDRHQRKGLGCKLVGVLIEIGREKVIDGIVGQVRTEHQNKLDRVCRHDKIHHAVGSRRICYNFTKAERSMDSRSHGKRPSKRSDQRAGYSVILRREYGPETSGRNITGTHC